MYKKENIKITNKTGLHARPAAKFVQKANKFDSEIRIHFNEKEVNAKSIMGVMSLGISQGNLIMLKAKGSDEKDAVEKLSDYIEIILPQND